MGAAPPPIFKVAPLVGAWIEIQVLCFQHAPVIRRSPRGSVD